MGLIIWVWVSKFAVDNFYSKCLQFLFLKYYFELPVAGMGFVGAQCGGRTWYRRRRDRHSCPAQH